MTYPHHKKDDDRHIKAWTCPRCNLTYRVRIDPGKREFGVCRACGLEIIIYKP